MLSQFTAEVPGQQTLADLSFSFPKDVYPVGRLDSDSEGLLILTNDRRLNEQLLNPKKEHSKTYWAQVEGIPDAAAMEALARGVQIKVNGKSYQTLPAKAALLAVQPILPERDPPIRVRKTVPDSWIELTITEGKNRQVRKMCAAIGYPVLRLVRVAIGTILLDKLQPGEVVSINH